MVKKKTIEIQLRSSTPKKLAKASAEPNVTPRLISKATNNLNSSSRNVVLDFGDDPKPTQPTQASGGDNLHVGGSQGIVDLQNDVEQARFWTKASKNESEDAKEWSEFCNNFKEVGPGGPSVRGDRYEFGDQEGSSEDDGYEQLLETDDEAKGNVNELIASVFYLYGIFVHVQCVSLAADKLKIENELLTFYPDFLTNVLEEDNGSEVVNGSSVDQSLEIPNGHREWFYDYEDIFGEDLGLVVFFCLALINTWIKKTIVGMEGGKRKGGWTEKKLQRVATILQDQLLE
ncbi:hypothetical protein C5167_044216 [Papaver somniferum]|uniref:Uncharacterized protein n=1 Tax=Papaver somniferum TaxID=3469 RepID=A0A4Y7LBU0_PAPSO|nr:hypothetical protein C5167_044216 [Papaver somniferum]